MRYSDIANYPRRWDREKYPTVAHVFIPSKHFNDFEQLIQDQAATTVLGHDVTDNDEVLVYVACTSDDVKAAIESRWR